MEHYLIKVKDKFVPHRLYKGDGKGNLLTTTSERALMLSSDEVRDQRGLFVKILSNLKSDGYIYEDIKIYNEEEPEDILQGWWSIWTKV